MEKDRVSDNSWGSGGVQEVQGRTRVTLTSQAGWTWSPRATDVDSVDHQALCEWPAGTSPLHRPQTAVWSYH